MKKSNYNGKVGISSKLLDDFIRSNLKREEKRATERTLDKDKKKSEISQNPKDSSKKRNVKRSKKLGKLHTPDIHDISVGFTGIERMTDEGLDILRNNILQGENKEVNKLQRDVVICKGTIDLFLRRIDSALRNESDLRSHVESLRSDYRTAQAARDGVILKQETRKEIDENGKEVEVKFDVSMTESEVIHDLEKYRYLSELIKYNKIRNYIGVGINTIASLGMIGRLKNNEEKESNSKKSNSSVSLVSIGMASISLMRILTQKLPEKFLEDGRNIRNLENRKTEEFLYNEQISYNAEQDSINELEHYARKSKNAFDKKDNIQLSLDAAVETITAIITGMFVHNQVKIQGKTSLDSKTFAKALTSLGTTEGYLGGVLTSILRMRDDAEMEDEIKYLATQVEQIEKQMQEKVYPLIGAEEPFDSFEISNLDGKFYPIKNYKTDEISYGVRVKVPEFSIKRGEVTLLTGDSGSGKSTFLRLLKRGDINNRNCIKLDNGKIVDNLGKEYIAFKPSTELGNEGTVLNQITGKGSVSELEPDKKENLIRIMMELNLYDDEILNELASKKFKQFSTGQQRRLALSKVFYRIKDGTSVIIVDEPVGNVEDSLIREQLELIKKYAIDNNMMMILVTHRIDLAEDIADKRYHISKDGLMQEIPIQNKEKEQSL